MQVVCEATQNPSVQVQVAAFETLVRIMSLYYDKMAYYMERALFGVRLQSHNNNWALINYKIAYRIGDESP
jgi:importin subunit beta-1